MILASGYLFIHNVLYISVSRNVRYFGQLKTLGLLHARFGAIFICRCYGTRWLVFPLDYWQGRECPFDCPGCAEPCQSDAGCLSWCGIQPCCLSGCRCIFPAFCLAQFQEACSLGCKYLPCGSYPIFKLSV